MDPVLYQLMITAPRTLPLAHLGHWYIQIMFVAPVVILVGVLSFQSWRENRQRRERGDGTPPPGPGARG